MQYEEKQANFKFSYKLASVLVIWWEFGEVWCTFGKFSMEYPLCDTQLLYMDDKQCLRSHLPVPSWFCLSLRKYICSGLSNLCTENWGVVRHTVPILKDQYFDEGPSFHATTFYHSKDCDIFVDSPNTSCLKCKIASDRVSRYSRNDKNVVYLN